MKKGLSKAVSFCMMIGLLAQSLYIPAMAEEAATEIAAESDTISGSQQAQTAPLRQRFTTMALQPLRSRTVIGIRSVPVMRKGM